MKNCILTFIFAFSLNTGFPQHKLLSALSSGGQHDCGKLISIDYSSGQDVTIYSFEEIYGRDPQRSQMIEGANGKLYGLASDDSPYVWGNIIFEFNFQTKRYRTLHNFDSAFCKPYLNNSLIYLPSGKLVGAIQSDKQMENGFLFVYDLNMDSLKIIHEFTDDENGAWPTGHLLHASNGIIYGTCMYGGWDMGLVYSLDPGSWEYEALDWFSLNTGQNPESGMIEASDGKFYGLAKHGGYNRGKGLIFSFDPITEEIRNEYTFTSGEGYYPAGILSSGEPGTLLGLTTAGGAYDAGTAFSFDIYTHEVQTIYDFNDSITGIEPGDNIAKTTEGEYFTLTRKGGEFDGGCLISIHPLQNTMKVEFDFDNKFGQYPMAGLTEASDDCLYGSTNSIFNSTIFRYQPSLGIMEKCFTFGSNPDGERPYPALFHYQDDLFYGITTKGGIDNCGVLFQYSLNNNVYSALHQFESGSDYYCGADLYVMENGEILGTKQYGGKFGKGSIFHYKPVENTFQVLKNFENYNTGTYPCGQLLKHPNGYFFGRTLSGCLYRYDLDQNEFFRLHNLPNAISSESNPNLVMAEDENLYGVANKEICGSDTEYYIFQYNTSTWTFQKVYSFDTALFSIVKMNLTATPDRMICGIVKHAISNDYLLFEFSIDEQSMRLIKLPEINIQGNQYYSEFTSLESGNFVFARSAENWRGDLLEYDYVKDTLRFISNFPVGNFEHTHFSHLRFAEINLTGISENQIRNSIKIYPQPACDHIFVDMQGTSPPCQVVLYDVSGRRVFIRDIHQESSRIELSSLPKGIYLLHLINDDERALSTAKIIRQ